MATLVNLSNVEIIRESNRVLKRVNLTLKSGEIIMVHGNNGCGKSSLLQCVFGLIKPQSGTVNLLAEPLESLRFSQISALRRRIGYIDQSITLLFDKSVKQNLKSVLKASGMKDKDDIENRVSEVIELFGLSSKAETVATKLSCAEQQMLMIARAIVAKPELLLADMPFNNLDSNSKKFVVDLFNRLTDEGAGIIMTALNDKADALRNATTLHCANHTIE